jgi:hypothetical protein
MNRVKSSEREKKRKKKEKKNRNYPAVFPITPGFDG